MSVPEGLRGEGKYDLLIKSRDLASYTIKICCNENVFLPKFQNALTNDLIATAKDIFMKCWTASNLKVTTDKGREKKRDLQIEAYILCNNLLALMQIAQQLYHLSAKRIKYWGNKTLEVRSMIIDWMKSES